jgi:glycosyltransferase involved in cell wall biosynthesis
MLVRSFSESGGLELYAHRLVEGLLARGHRVTVICEVSDSQLQHAELEKLFFSPAPLSMSKAARIKHYFFTASRFVLDHGPFDIIHSQHLPMTGANVVTFHNHTATRLSEVGQGWERLLNRAKMFYSKAYRLRYEQDKILCQAPILIFPAAVTLRDFVATYSLARSANFNRPNSFFVAHPGANFPTVLNQSNELVLNEHQKKSNLSNSSHEPFTFLFVGKGFRKKGLDVLLRACLLLKKRGFNFRLLVAGLTAKALDKMRLKVMGLSDMVEYLGFRKDMKVVYELAQVIVLPSRVEPFGMAPVQGMFHGLVPIVSRVSGVSEVLIDGVDSLILKDHLSATELGSLMIRLMENPEQLRSMSEKARQTAAALTWEKTIDATLAAYKVLIEKESRPI